MKSIDFYRKEFEAYLKSKIAVKSPKNLYEPMVYILNLGGKRLRPIAVLMAADFFDCDYKKAMDAALAIEIFHNFSLVHDDIMDDAPLRRGRKSVHEKWDINTAILSGDAMLINAYQLFENYQGNTFKALAQLFSKTAVEVCEGQQYDIDFENEEEVGLNDYLKMINLKTAVLLGAALKMGAIVAQASDEDSNQIYEYGRLLGIAFQIKDDYLDIFGDEKTFGKQVGGDIIENKKTYLFIKALEMASEKDQKQLKHLYSIFPENSDAKIETISTIFKENEVEKQTLLEIENYTRQAFQQLEQVAVKDSKKQIFKAFGKNLMNRTF